MVNTHMLVGTVYERMGLSKAPKAIASKPLLSFILESLGHIPKEDESFVYERLEITPKAFENGRVIQVVIHILDDEDIEKLESYQIGEEVLV